MAALFNEKGGRQVWVKVFYSDFESDWRTEISMINDAGNLYFNFYVNLSKQSFGRLHVNGTA